MDLTGMLQAAAGSAGGGEIEPLGVDYDGTNDYLSRATDLTGNADGKTFTFSCWMYQDRDNDFYPYTNGRNNVGTFNFYSRVETDGKLNVAGYGTGGSASKVLDLELNGIPENTFVNVLISVDLANASNRHVYINDVDYTSSVSFGNYTNADISFSEAFAHTIANRWIFNTADKFAKGRLAGVYLDYTYRDLSIEANRRLFIDDDGLYVTPPTTGIISVPMDDPADPGRNDGTGGNFTLNGVVARSGRGPNEYNAAASALAIGDSVVAASLPNITSTGYTISANLKTELTDQAIPFWVEANSLNVQSQLSVLTTGVLRISAYDYATSTALINITADEPLVAYKWYCIQAVIDPLTSGNNKLYVNGVEVAVTVNTFVSRASHILTANAQVGNATNAEVSDVYFVDTKIDLSTSNPFYDTETDKPKFLGATGELPTGSAPLIYLPLYASSAGTNLGTGGDFTVNSGPYVGARGPSEFWADSAAFNGSNQYLNRTSALSGISDGTNITLAFSFKVDVVGSGDGYLIELHNGSSRSTGINCFFNDGSDNFSFSCFNTSATGDGNNYVFSGNSASNSVVAGAWNTVLISANASNAYIYFNGTSLSLTTSLGSNINLDLANWGIGRRDDNGTLYLDGNIGFLYFNNSYIDFSQEANRLKFFDAFNNPVDLGEDGSTPTGSQPLIYMNEGFHLGTNLGSGGNFTPQNTPTDGGYVNG